MSAPEDYNNDFEINQEKTRDRIYKDVLSYIRPLCLELVFKANLSDATVLLLAAYKIDMRSLVINVLKDVIKELEDANSC